MAALLLIVATVFAPALAGGFVYDDQELIVANPGLHDPFDLLGLWTRPLWGEQLGHWRPLTAWLLAGGWWIGAGQPWAIHALALMLHLAATLGVARLWRGLGGGDRGALFAAALFALHPAQVESVAWCAALNDVLAGCGTIWTLALWLEGHPRRAMLCAALAMLAKEGGVLAPLLLIALGIARWRDRRPAAATWLPGLSLLAGYWTLRALVFGELAAGLFRGADNAADAGLLHAGRIAAGLSAHLLWPVGRDLFAAARDVGAVDLALAAVLSGVVAVNLCVPGRRRFVALLIAAPIALPAILHGNLGPYPIADRYLCLAAGGLALLMAADRGRVRIVAMLVAAAAMAVGSSLHIADFADQATMVERALQRHPEDPRLHYMRGRVLLEGPAGPSTLSRARAAFAQAQRLLADDDPTRLPAEIANALANCSLLASQGAAAVDWSAVEREFAQITVRWPAYPDAYVGLGIVLASTGRAEGAENAFRRAIDLDPATPGAARNLGRLLLLTDRAAAALEPLRAAARIAPDDQAVQQLLREAETATGGARR